MRTTLARGAILASVLGLSFSGTASADKIELTISNWVPATHAMTTEMFLPWAKAIEKATEGRVRARTLPTAVASPREHFDAIRNGLADVTIIVPGYTSGRFHLTKIVEFPFVNVTATASSVAYWRVHEKYLVKGNEHRGVTVLSVFGQGPAQLFTTNRPVKSIADMSGLKVRTGGEMAGITAQALGMTALQRPVGEVYEMLSRGVADGVVIVPESLLSFNLSPVLKHGTLLPGGFYGGSFSLIMNEKKFQSIPEADRNAIMSVSGEAFARMAGEAWDRAIDRGMKDAADKGIEIVNADDALQAEVRKRTEAMVNEWIEGAGKKDVDGEAALAELRREIDSLTK